MFEKFFVVVGEGVIDWLEVFCWENEFGMQYFFVEQDLMWLGNQFMDQIVISYGYFEEMWY